MPGPAPKAQGKIQALAAFAAVTGRRAERKLGPVQALPAKRRPSLDCYCALSYLSCKFKPYYIRMKAFQAAVQSRLHSSP